MRIISGTHKGRQINPPSTLPARPTTDFAKTGLFNILNNYFDFEKISVLDLFCGTGNISFEFASRGAREMVSVDENFPSIAFIREVSGKLHFQNIETIKSDVFKYLAACTRTFDIIFADPPYEMKGIEKIPEMVLNRKLLNKNGWLIVEHSQWTDFHEHTGFFEKRVYGNVNFSFFK